MKKKIGEYLTVCLYVLALFFVLVAVGCNYGGNNGCSSDNGKSNEKPADNTPKTVVIQVENTEDIKVEIGNKALIPSAKAVDGNGAEIEGYEITILVYDPTDEIESSIKNSSFTCGMMGEYRIVYSAKSAEDVVVKAIVADYSGPEYEITPNGSQYQVGETCVLPGITFIDYSDIDYSKTSVDMFYDNNGTLESYTYNEVFNSFVPNKAGTYILKCRATDVHGNFTDKDIKLNVVDPEWKDTDLPAGVFADFSSKEYAYMFEPGSISMWLNHNEFEYFDSFQGENGVLCMTANYGLRYAPGWWCCNIKFFEPVNINEIDALAIKVWIDPTERDYLSTIYCAQYHHNVPNGSGMKQALGVSDEGWTIMYIRKSTLQAMDAEDDNPNDGYIDGIELGGGAENGGKICHFYFSEIFAAEIPETPYVVGKGGASSVDPFNQVSGLYTPYDKYITVSEVNNHIDIADGESIEGYTKIKVDKAVDSIGVTVYYDDEKIQDATNVAFYVKFKGTMSCFTDKSIDLGACLSHIDLKKDTWGPGVRDVITYGDWVKVICSKSSIKDDIKLFLFSYFGDKGFTVGDELWVSDFVYFDYVDPYEEKYGAGIADLFIQSGGFYRSYMTVDEVTQSVSVCGDSVDGYTKITLKDDVKSLAYKVNYDETKLAAADSVILYFKGDVNYMSLCTTWPMTSDTIHANQDLREAAGTGVGNIEKDGEWYKITFSRGAIEDYKTLVFWKGVNDILNEGDEICISDFVYVVLPVTIVPCWGSPYDGDVGQSYGCYFDSGSPDSYYTKTEINEPIIVDGVTIDRYTKITTIGTNTAAIAVKYVETDADKLAACDYVAICIKNKDMNMAVNWANAFESGAVIASNNSLWAEEAGTGVRSTEVFGDWVRVTFTKGAISEDIKMLLFSPKGGGKFAQDTEICVSDLIYVSE